MAWLTLLTVFFQVLQKALEVWAGHKQTQAQTKDTDHAYKIADKWANRAVTAGDTADRLRERAERKRAAKSNK